MESGGDAVYKPSEELIKNNPDLYADYNGVIDPSANNIGIANAVNDVSLVGQPVDYLKMNPMQKIVNEGGIISNAANKVAGMNAMSIMHDPWGQNTMVGSFPALQISIIPAIAIEYCAISPAACATVTSKLINNDFGTQE